MTDNENFYDVKAMNIGYNKDRENDDGKIRVVTRVCWLLMMNLKVKLINYLINKDHI